VDGRAFAAVWSVGPAYEAYVGRWSRPVARELLRWLDVPAGSRWLDVGCGTGALTQAILDDAAPRAVHGVDRSPGFVAHARSRVVDSRGTFAVGDAQALGVRGAAFDAVVSGLVVNFVQDPARMVGEMARAGRSGGAVAAYVWDYAGAMEPIRMFWQAAAELDPSASALDEGTRFPLCAPPPLAELFSTSLSAVETRAIDVPAFFRDFDDYWSPFLGGQGPAPSYATSLPEERRAALRERLRETLPIAPDGSLRLAARAWAVRGRPRLDGSFTSPGER
jgi:trans-aconitate methyltransferase